MIELIATYNAHDKQRLLQLYHPDFEGEDMSEGKKASGILDATRMFDYTFGPSPIWKWNYWNGVQKEINTSFSGKPVGISGGA